MKQIVSISLGSGKDDYDFEGVYIEKDFRIRRFGTDGSMVRAMDLIVEWSEKADAIGIGGLKYPYLEKSKKGVKKLIDIFKIFDDDISRLLNFKAQIKIPITTGTTIANVADEWAIRHLQFEMGNYFTNSRVVFISGIYHYHMAHVLSDFTDNLKFCDPIFDAGISKMLNSLKELDIYEKGFHDTLQLMPLKYIANNFNPLKNINMNYLKDTVKDAFIVVIPPNDFNSYIDMFDLNELKGKTVITSNAYDDRINMLKEKGVDVIIDTAPKVLDKVVGFNVLEALIHTVLEKNDGDLTNEDLLELISIRGKSPRPSVVYPSGTPKRVNRFAFVIHPLSQEQFKLDKTVRRLSKIPGIMDTVEKIVAYSPPWIYSKVTGIKSPKGVESEGWLITLGGTPKQMLTHSPEFTYKRLLQAADLAKKLGAQIMGLGAFTKVVGDAGITVAKKAELPITTGNSYSASGALWAAADAVRKMGLIETEEGKKIVAKAMVFGASGAIGSVCCRLLAMAFSEVYLCGRNPIKLLALKDSILKETPGAVLHILVNPDKHLPDMDVIVTATSGMGKKVLDIMKVKPGCVITDVARPLDLSPEQVAMRPDVLVIESGEIELPGNPEFQNIGLPPKVAYACLAETIVLALEGKFEVFTIGRDIEWEKVKAIYKMGLKHGMKLAAISGVNGVFTDEDIARVRYLALEARKNQNKQ